MRPPEDEKLREEESRSMTPEERVALAVDMSSVVIRIVVDSIRDQHPRWSEKQIIKEARRRIYYDRHSHREV